MKTIGMLGGMSWESTIPYYRIINTIVKEKLGGLHSAKCVLYSVDFAEIEKLQSTGAWEESGEILARAAVGLEKAGADFLIICTNTMHKVAPIIQKKIDIPIVHIADVTADALLENDVKKVALLGTRYTMEQGFYKSRLTNRGLSVLVPDDNAMDYVNAVIFNELCLGEISAESKKRVLAIVDALAERGAQAVILGCTEIGLLINQEDTKVPLYDTTKIHAERAALYALQTNCPESAGNQ